MKINHRNNRGKVNLILIAAIAIFAVALTLGMLLVLDFQDIQGTKPTVTETPAPTPTAEPEPSRSRHLRQQRS